MIEFVPIPRVDYQWAKVLGDIPKGQAAQLHYNNRHSAVLAGESARGFARNNKLGKLHTSIVGGVLDSISGSYQDADCDAILTIWF